NDDDGNRQSNLATPDLNLIRLDRVRLGDTLTASMSGVMIGSNSFAYGYASMTIDQGQYISPAGASVRVYDASSSTYISCDSIPITQTDDTLFVADFSSSSIGGYCTDFASFQYTTGDSIWVTANLKVSSTSTNDLDVGYVNPMELYVSSVANPTDAQRAGCGSGAFSAKFQIVPMTDASFVNSVSSNACGQTQARTYLNFFNAGSYLDMFPYEYRPWSFPDTIIVSPPTDYDFVNAYLLLRYSPYVNTQYVTPAYTSADTLLFDLRALVNAGGLLEPDDGYELQFFTTWEPHCYSQHNSAIEVPTEVIMHWEEGLEAYDNPTTYLPEIQHYAPAIELSNVSASTQDGLSSSVDWTISLSNTTLNSASPYTFLAFASPSGLISVSDVTNSSGGSLTANNNIYELGTLSANSNQQYTLTADYSSCSLDTLYVFAGWNCDAYPTDLSSFACEIDTFILRVDPKPSAVQLNVVSQPSGSIALCQDLDYTFAITSTQMANVVDLVVDVYHNNSGLEWVDGTAEIEYPSGSGFRTVTNPDTIPGGFRFALDNYDATLASEGLEGLGGTSAANRTVNIRFNTQANCDFISGDVFYVQLSGAQPCGSPVSVLRVMDPISVSGVVAPYNTTITNTANSLEGCNQQHDFRIKLIPDGTTGSGDKIRLNIPEGVDMVGGSFSAVRNAPNSATMISSSLGSLGMRYEWDMPVSVAAGDSIIFMVQLSSGDDTGCGDNSLLATVQTTFDANVVCGGTNCPTYYGSSGSASTYLQLEKPDLTLDQLSSGVSDAGTDYIFGIYWVLQNLGSDLDATTTTVEFFVDLDSSLTYSAGDRYLGSYSNPVSIPSGSSQALNTSLTVPKDSADLNKPLLGLVRQSPGSGAGPAQCLCDSLNLAASMDVVLPLVWQELRVTASPNANLVHWVAEVQDGSFVVERRSPKEENWHDLSPEIVAENQVQTYEYPDLDKSVLTYYRVRHTDLGGEQSWSPIVLAERFGAWQASIQPNPAKEWVEIEAPIGTHYRLLDTHGRPLQRGQLDQDKIRLALKELPAGIYLIQLEREHQQQSWKLEVR
ncbi:MAG: T9SS type A sorting domain-containing protein, partial [Bacteroidota bacterium]